MSVAEQSGRPEPEQTLEGLLALVGRFVELSSAPRGVGAAVGGVVVRRAGGAGAAGVVFRPEGTGSQNEALRAAATETGTALLFRGWWTDWPTLIRMLQAGVQVAQEPGTGSVPLGDLDRLADAIALQVGGAVTIEDLRSTVLAHSATGETVAPYRRRAILAGKVPQGRIGAMRRAGLFRDLWNSTDVLRRAAEGDIPERLIVAVRAGVEPLGPIWVAAAGRPLPPAAAKALREVARAAAPHLLHHRSRQDEQDGLAAGRAARAELPAARSGLHQDERCVVLSVHAAAGTGTGGGDAHDRLAGQVLEGCVAGGHLPVVVPSKRGVGGRRGGLSKDPHKAADQVSRLSGALACELSQRLRVPVRIGIGEVQERLDRAPHSRRTADQALRALLFGTSSLACARAADLADSVALLHFLDALRESVPPVQTPVGRLVAYADAKGESVLLDTLRAFVENQADRSRAAEARAVHRNTFNHRLDKTPVRECGIDLKDPDALLLAQLQLRLLSHHDAGWD